MKDTTFPLSVPELAIGSDPSNPLPIRDATLSFKHCVLRVANGRYTIEDLGSGSGTLVNGVAVKEQALQHGDLISIGGSVLVFLLTEQVPLGGTDRYVIARRGDREPRFALAPESEQSMVGESQRMKEVYQFLSRVARSHCTVLIEGESGTGKELAARAIHRISHRSDKPFVTINCAAIPEGLLETELFGHERGSFTGAVTQKKGRLEIADGGTVFLDEVAEMSPALQVKLLRVLQEREFERVGGNRSIRVNIRLIAATNKNLERAVSAGSFRQDLYYRLNVVSLVMPPLRERREDIPMLSEYFILKYGRKYNARERKIAPETMACLMKYDWPGNVRELENVLERALVLGRSECLCPEDLPSFVQHQEAPEQNHITRYHDALDHLKKRLIVHAINEASGNYTRAAQFLGLHPNYLHRLIRNLKLRSVLRPGPEVHGNGRQTDGQPTAGSISSTLRD